MPLYPSYLHVQGNILLHPLVSPQELDLEIFVFLNVHCVKSIQIESFFWSVFSCIRTEQISVFSLNTEKYGPEKTPHLDTFHGVSAQCIISQNVLAACQSFLSIPLRLSDQCKNYPQLVQKLSLTSLSRSNPNIFTLLFGRF